MRSSSLLRSNSLTSSLGSTKDIQRHRQTPREQWHNSPRNTLTCAANTPADLISPAMHRLFRTLYRLLRHWNHQPSSLLHQTRQLYSLCLGIRITACPRCAPRKRRLLELSLECTLRLRGTSQSGQYQRHSQWRQQRITLSPGLAQDSKPSCKKLWAFSPQGNFQYIIWVGGHPTFIRHQSRGPCAMCRILQQVFGHLRD